MKVVGALLSRGLIAERITEGMAKADSALNRIWRNEPDGRGVLLLITPAGLDAIGIEPTADHGATNAEEPANGRPRAPRRRRSNLRRGDVAVGRRRRPRAGARPLRARPATARSSRS